MPLSFGVPLGIAVVLIGLVLYFVAHRKGLALVIVGIGVVIALATLVAILLAVASAM